MVSVLKICACLAVSARVRLEKLPRRVLTQDKLRRGASPPRRAPLLETRRLRLGGPVDGFDRTDQERPEENAQGAKDGSDRKRSEEVAGALKNKTGEGRCDDAGKVGDAVLRAVPFADGLIAGDSLWKRKDTGRSGAAADAGDEQPRQIGVCAGERAAKQPGDGHDKAQRHGEFANEGRSESGANEKILQPAG